jgi:predicted small metal-binding protein
MRPPRFTDFAWNVWVLLLSWCPEDHLYQHYPSDPAAMLVANDVIARHQCIASLYQFTRTGMVKIKGVIRMMSLNCGDLGTGHSFELTGTNEQEIMRKFIVYAEDELKMPVLSCDTILRVHMAIKK